MKHTRIISLMLSLVLMLSLLAGCGGSEPAPTTPATEATQPQIAATEPAKRAVKVEKTAIQAQEARYVPIDEVGTYNEQIITPELLASNTLPQLDKANLPYWTGLILEDKISVNCKTSGWNYYTAGSWYWNEEEIRYMAENGFNCVRALYSLSFLSHPEDVMQINVSELEQLDELISWCIKYDMHLILSQTGLPGKWNYQGSYHIEDYDYWHTQENVVGNPELYTSKEMQETNLRYYEMLAKRYQNIPNGVLSFELAVESFVPDGDVQLQADVLGPVAQKIWSYTPDRIVIVNDIGGAVPRPLAELGCCISLHDHVYSIDGSILDQYGVDYEPHWPIQYLPDFINEQTNPLVIRAEDTFAEGELALHLAYRNDWPIVLIDGQVVHSRTYGDPVYEAASLRIPIPAGAKEIEIRFECEMVLNGLTLRQGDVENTLVTNSTHSIEFYSKAPDKMPVLQVGKDLTITDVSEAPVSMNDYVARVPQLFAETAKECGVSFLMTEVGTDAAASLTPDEYLAYEACWLDYLKENNISWMYNCIHNILAPEQMMWLNQNNSQFTEFSKVPDMFGYSVNDTIMNFLKSYTKN